MIKNREWIFRICLKLEPGERVCITGSCSELGSWDPKNLLDLVREGSHDGLEMDCESIWRISLRLPTDKIMYRFCVCMGTNNAVRRWETNLHPRILPANESNSDDPEILYFGYINSLNKVDQGWLINECCLFLRLCRSNLHNDPVLLWKKKHKNKKCFVKVTPIDLHKNSSMESILDYPTEESTEVELMELRMKSRALLPVVEVSVLKEGSTEYRSQDQFGVCCTDEEYISFQCKLADSQAVGFLMDYYLEMSEAEVPQYVGCSFILPTAFKDNYGLAILPISSPKHIPIGQLTVTYMVVHPLRDYKCNMEVSYARHWKESWRGLEVGHRGAGNSFHSQPRNCANIRENTIASLKHAYESGADMVEFDVQLSKDLVPLIYHDFHASIALKHKREPLKTDLMEIPIKDLTLAQLQNLKVYHLSEQGGFSRFGDDDFEDHQPFPTLERALERLPQSCGFNIEVRWTMRMKDGTYELDHPFELNRFLDSILKVVLQSSSSRKIIFSSFHPDICTMLRLKQNLYPVLFLTIGETNQWKGYDDIRTRTISRAVYYASGANILGVNVHTEDILQDASQIKLAFDHNLIAFCWGDHNSDREVINLLKGLGMHGIIYDKIDEYITKDSKRNCVFLCEDKETCRCFPAPCQETVNSDEKEYSCQMELSAKAVDNKSSPSEEIVTEKHGCTIGDQTSISFCGILNEMSVEPQVKV